MNRPGFTSTGLQWCWDATSLGALCTCPQFYNYTIRQGFRPHEPSFHLTFGKLLHTGWEEIKRSLHRGKSREEALLDGLQAVLRAAWSEEHFWTCPSCEEAVSESDTSCFRCGADFAQTPKLGQARAGYWESDDPERRKTFPNLLRTIIWGFEDLTQVLVTAQAPSGAPMIEWGLEVDLERTVPGTNQPYRMRARLDEVVTDGAVCWILEKKSTSKTLGLGYFSTFSPNTQVSLQDWLGSQRPEDFPAPLMGVMVEAHQVGVHFSRFRQEPARRSPERRDEFTRSLHFWLDVAEKCAQDGTQDWPMNEKACYNCEFKSACNTPPSLRKGFLAANFERRFWDPAEGVEHVQADD